MNNELLLMTGEDIPFIEAQTVIHQPKIYEISFIGEEVFWSGSQFLNFSKKIVDTTQDKIDLTDIADFEIFMSIMTNPEALDYKNYAKQVLTLIFPSYQYKFNENELVLMGGSGIGRINKDNFDVFKDILVNMFGLEDIGANGGYNPQGKRAEKIAEKLEKAKARKAKAQGGNITKVSLLSRYMSILAVGEHKDLNELKQYTVFQLKDEFKRFQMKQSFDIYMSAKMAGATGLDEVDNWMDDIHS